MYTLTSALPSYNLSKKRVLLRADLNVPLYADGAIASNFKLKALLPTINFIIEQGAHLLLLTHWGKQSTYNDDYSTKKLCHWFEQHGYKAAYTPTIPSREDLSENNFALMENVRFFPQEQNLDFSFAQQLRNWADYYINDAFGALHRNETTLTLLPTLFPPEKRTIGFLIQRELSSLNRLFAAEKPFLIILGGRKSSTKIPLIENMMNKADTILLCPALVFTFLKAQGKDVGLSYVDEPSLYKAEQIIKKDKQSILRFPLDYQVSSDEKREALFYTDPEHLKDTIGISIGPKTIALFVDLIQHAKTIFFNGPMGFLEDEKTCRATQILLESIAHSSAFSVIGGGDSIAFVEKYRLEKDICFLSTGGGSTLAYLGGEKLCGLSAFLP